MMGGIGLFSLSGLIVLLLALAIILGIFCAVGMGIYYIAKRIKFGGIPMFFLLGVVVLFTFAMIFIFYRQPEQWFVYEHPETGHIVRVDFTPPSRKGEGEHRIHIYVNDFLLHETFIYNQSQMLTTKSYHFEWWEPGTFFERPDDRALLMFSGQATQEIRFEMSLCESEITLILINHRHARTDMSSGSLFRAMRGGYALWFYTINLETDMHIRAEYRTPFKGSQILYVHVNDEFAFRTRITRDNSAFRAGRDGRFYIEWLSDGAIVTMFTEREVEVKFKVEIIDGKITYTELHCGFLWC